MAERTYRDYETPARDTVADFYRDNHRQQTLAFARGKRDEYASGDRANWTIREAAEQLDTLVDDSDPDTALSQLQHLMQTGEALRRDGQPRWLQLTGFIHDLGKVLCLFGEPQWAVVGDTFPLGCRFSDRIVYPECFADNPDALEPRYQSRLGIYGQGCGLDAVTMSWGHDEYLWMVVGDRLPLEAQYVIRYHSFYAAHTEDEYDYLMNESDRAMFDWVRRFQPYDLYSKGEAPPDVDALWPYYEGLIEEFLPGRFAW